MKNQEVDLENKALQIQCDDCDIGFKSNYHLENHMKSSQHLIKSGLDRKFKYKLNQKTTKSKLLKGAQKLPFEKYIKSNCIVIEFSDGSYLYSVLQTIESWKRSMESNSLIKTDDMEIKVTEVKHGKEVGGMCVDTLVRFEMNENKVVAHCYNTKSKILINGQGYSKFVERYLEPAVKKIIGENLLPIQNYNTVVTETLGNIKHKDVKFRPGSKLACNKCEYSSETSSNMSAHRRNLHSNVLDISDIVNKKALTSTRDNKFRL